MYKIYDCFTFFDELDLLEMRFKMLSSAIDYFVLVECAKTQTGNTKPFYYEENKERFSKWNDKIIHIKVNDISDISHEIIEDWSIENHQRNCIFRGLTYAKPNDIIIISDIDEFPNPYLLNHLNEYIVKENTNFKQKIKKMLKLILHPKRNSKALPLDKAIDYSPIALEQKFFYYYMNCQKEKNWHGSVILRFKQFRLPQVLRDNRNSYPFVAINNKEPIKTPGWHFSYLGGEQKILNKLNSIIEGHLINDVKIPENMSTEQYVKYCMENGIDIFQRENENCNFITIEKIGIPDANQFAQDYKQFFRMNK